MAERPRKTQLPGTDSVSVAVPTVALGSDDDQVIWTNKTGSKVRLTAVTYTPETAVTGDDTNTLKLQLRNKGVGGAGAVGVTADKKYGTGVDLTAFKPDALVLSATLTERDVDIDETVALNKTEDGTGLALPEGVVTLEFQYV